jgi:hypothetical protein
MSYLSCFFSFITDNHKVFNLALMEGNAMRDEQQEKG